jgi:hypothetical protein
LSEYEEIQKRDFPPGKDTPQDRLRHLVLRAGIDLETFWTQWLSHALDEFEHLDEQPPAPGAGPEDVPEAGPEDVRE